MNLMDQNQSRTFVDYLRRLKNRFIFRSAQGNLGMNKAFIPSEYNDFRPHALRHHWLHTYAIGLVMLKVLVIVFVGFYAGPAHPSDITATNIIHLTNNARSAAKVPVLHSNALLAKAATSKANDMIRQQYFAHVSPTNITPWAWFKQAGYNYSYAGENLAIDFIQSEDVIQAWLNSPSHKRNLLSTRYVDTGVAVASGKINGVTSLLVVQMFGAPVTQPVVRTASTPIQTPSVPVAIKQAQQTPVVLGETTPPAPTPPPPPLPKPTPPPPVSTPAPIAPVTPTLLTPAPNTIVKTTSPAFVGATEVGSQVTLFIDSLADGTTTAKADGTYSLSPLKPVSEGSHTVSVQASARGLTSTPTSPQTMTIDTLPPTIVTSRTFALFSLAAPDTYDVVVTPSSDATKVTCQCGTVTADLEKYGDAYVGQIHLAGGSTPTNSLNVVTTDVAGNEVTTFLVDPDLFSTGVVQASDSPAAMALRVIFYSRTFMMIFLVLMFVLATMNIVIRLEHQHHPTIVGALLVMYLAGALLMI